MNNQTTPFNQPLHRFAKRRWSWLVALSMALGLILLTAYPSVAQIIIRYPIPNSALPIS